MRLKISIFAVLATLVFSSPVLAKDKSKKTSPEAVVVIAYISTLRCQAQHPKLRERLDKAFRAWKKRNRKYVLSAQKAVDFNGIKNQFESLKKRDKRIPLETCRAYIRKLRDPKSDLK